MTDKQLNEAQARDPEFLELHRDERITCQVCGIHHTKHDGMSMNDHAFDDGAKEILIEELVGKLEEELADHGHQELADLVLRFATKGYREMTLTQLVKENTGG